MAVPKYKTKSGKRYREQGSEEINVTFSLIWFLQWAIHLAKPTILAKS
jgi:hypothetical protein